MRGIGAILGIILIVLIIVVGIWQGNEDSSKYIYECVDYKGDTVYCINAYYTKGGLMGITDDGTKMHLNSYKKVLKEEKGN